MVNDSPPLPSGWRTALTWQSERQEQRGASFQPDRRGVGFFCLLRLLPFGVVGLGGFGLNHNGGVAMLVELRLVSDRPHHITGGES